MITDSSVPPAYAAHHTSRVPGLRLMFRARQAVRIVALLAAVVLGLGIFRQVFVIVLNADSERFGWNIINLDQEGNLPTWFSSLLLFAGGVAALLVARVAKQAEPRNARAWMLLGAIFVILSADEMMQLHEMAKIPLRAWREWSGLLMFPWVVLALPLVVVVGAAFAPFLLRVRRATANRLVVAGAIYVSGALVMEMLAGPVIEAHGRGGYYAICVILEEAGELAGAALFLRALLLHLADTVDEISIEMAGRA